MSETACVLDLEQRRLCEATVAEHCRIRGWHLHVVNCRSNHIHVVVTAPVAPKIVQTQLKAWCTRRLKELDAKRCVDAGSSSPIRDQWWAERGSRRYINDEHSLEQTIVYVRDLQDDPPPH